MYHATVFILRTPRMSDVTVKLNLGTPERVSKYASSLRKSCHVRVDKPQVRYLDREATCMVRPGMYNVIYVFCPNRQYFDATMNALRNAKNRGEMIRARSKGQNQPTRPGLKRRSSRTRRTPRPARTMRPRLAHFPRG